MSKHSQDIFFKVRCASKEQRERLKAKASELSRIMEVENAEMLEHLFDHALPSQAPQYAVMDRTPTAATDGVRPDEDR